MKQSKNKKRFEYPLKTKKTDKKSEQIFLSDSSRPNLVYSSLALSECSKVCVDFKS